MMVSDARPWLSERNERQRMFMHLSLDVFRKHTNIRELITESYKAEHNKNPLQIYLKHSTKRYFDQLKTSEGWGDPIFDNLNFKLPREEQNK